MDYRTDLIIIIYIYKKESLDSLVCVSVCNYHYDQTNIHMTVCNRVSFYLIFFFFFLLPCIPEVSFSF